jgi:DNA phosphorothioation-associated putative methyltransferase
MSEFMRRRGRIPQPDEMSAAARAELSEQNVSPARALDACLAVEGMQPDLEAAAADRREDLLVHYALGLLNRPASASRPSPAIVRDVRTHFSSQKELMTQATGYLHGLADEAKVQAAMTAAADGGGGLIDARGRLLVDSERADDLPGLLRCYFGCATFLSGEPEGRYVLRLDATRRRVTMWPITDPGAALPQIDLSVRVDLRRQEVRVRPDPRRLLCKSLLMGYGARSKQRRAEAQYRARHALADDLLFERLEPMNRADDHSSPRS